MAYSNVGALQLGSQGKVTHQGDRPNLPGEYTSITSDGEYGNAMSTASGGNLLYRIVDAYTVTAMATVS